MTETRDTLRFIDGEELREFSGFDPTLTLLDWLRLDERRMGTKEGCAEGDCGACTVVVGRLVGAQVTLSRHQRLHRAARLARWSTADHDRAPKRGGNLHPVQQAMVERHGSQCGFCTPGIVMSLFALWLAEEDASEERIEDALAGNLCRCTGYQPIIAAGRDMFAKGAQAKEAWRARSAEMAERLAQLQDDRRLEIVKDKRRFIAPSSLDDFAKVYARHRDATILAGATDVGLWITKEMRVLDTVIHPGRIAALEGVVEDDEALVFGAMTSLSDAGDDLGAHASASCRIAAPLRRRADQECRHLGRQYRQWLTDRRSCARAHRAGRELDAAAKRRSVASCRSRSSSSPISARIVARANSWKAVRVPKLGAVCPFPCVEDQQALR